MSTPDKLPAPLQKMFPRLSLQGVQPPNVESRAGPPKAQARNSRRSEAKGSEWPHVLLVVEVVRNSAGCAPRDAQEATDAAGAEKKMWCRLRKTLGHGRAVMLTYYKYQYDEQWLFDGDAFCRGFALVFATIRQHRQQEQHQKRICEVSKDRVMTHGKSSLSYGSRRTDERLEELFSRHVVGRG